MNSNKTESILVFLDVLLDTRLGTVAKISDELAAKVLSDNYQTRMDDNFKGVDVDQYRKLYAERDVETLAKSKVTNAILLLRHLTGILNEQAVSRPYLDGTRIVVNLFPYRLTEEEVDLMRKAVLHWIGGKSQVDFVNMSLEELSPSYCKANFAMMLMYEHEGWMELHTEAFKQTRLPEVTLFAPAIYFHKTPTQEELETVTKEGAHPFQAIEMLASPIVELKLIDVKYFSIVTE